VASALRNHHNVAVEALSALHYASTRVSYTSPNLFGKDFEVPQDWEDAWKALIKASNAEATRLEGLVHSSPSQWIRQKIEPSVKGFTKGFKGKRSGEALAHCTLKAARAGAEFVRNSLAKLYNLVLWPAAFNPAACHICREALDIANSSQSTLEQEAALSFALVIGLAAWAIDAVILSNNPQSIIADAEAALREHSELLIPAEGQDLSVLRDQARALVEVFAASQPSGDAEASGLGLDNPGEAISTLVRPGPDLLVPKAKPAARRNR
jgi:hypothetical protein